MYQIGFSGGSSPYHERICNCSLHIGTSGVHCCARLTASLAATSRLLWLSEALAVARRNDRCTHCESVELFRNISSRCPVSVAHTHQTGNEGTVRHVACGTQKPCLSNMQQLRLSHGSSARCTATSSASGSRTVSSSRTSTTCTQAACTEVATASAENTLRRQVLQTVAAATVAAVLPLSASAATVAAGDWSSPGLAAPEGKDRSQMHSKQTGSVTYQ